MPLTDATCKPLVTVFMHGRTARVAAMGDGDAGSEDLSRRGFAPAIEVNSLDTAKQVTRRTNALFPGSASMLASEFSHGELVRLDFDGPELRTHPTGTARLRRPGTAYAPGPGARAQPYPVTCSAEVHGTRSRGRNGTDCSGED
jgi:hypothetical protein